MPDDTSTPTLTNEDLATLAQRVDQAFAEVQTMESDGQVKAKALKDAIEEFHKVGLTKIVFVVKADDRGKELLFELVDDPGVYALFAMHGLVRADLRTRVSRVIEMVRPYMQSHGGDVTFVDLQDATVYVRLSGSCNGCSMSSVTLKQTVEEALKEHVPEIAGVSVVPDAPSGVIPIESLITGSGPDSGNGSANGRETGWVEGPPSSDVEEGKPLAFDAGDVSVLLLKLDGTVKAYRNQCAHQGLPLDGGIVDCESQTITCPWHGWCFDTSSGECLTAPQAQLEQFPSRIENDTVWVRPL